MEASGGHHQSSMMMMMMMMSESEGVEMLRAHEDDEDEEEGEEGEEDSGGVKAPLLIGESSGSSSSTASCLVSNSVNVAGGGGLSRYEAQKRRDWNTFGQYLRNHRPPLSLPRCSGAHVLEFLRYLDQFGKTKVHVPACPFFGHPQPPSPCACPLRQAWGSLDALIGRLRAAFEEHGGQPESNPFGARAVRLYLREVRDLQAKARGIAYQKKKRKPRPPPPTQQQQQQQQQTPLPPQSMGQNQPLCYDHGYLN